METERTNFILGATVIISANEMTKTAIKIESISRTSVKEYVKY